MSMPIQDISVTPAGNKSEKPLKKEPSPIKSKEATKETLHANSPIKTTERCDSRQSNMSNSADICRICHCEGEPDGPLISPCLCSGSLKFVHQACLQKWLKSSDTTHCELCKFDFIMTSKVKPYKQWERLDMTSVERRKITCSVMFHVIAITCVIWSLYVLIDRTTEEIKAGVLEWPFWTKLIVVAIGFTGGVVFMYVQCKMYVRLCHRWRAYNCSIFIENSPEDWATRERLTQQIKETSFANPGLHELELL